MASHDHPESSDDLVDYFVTALAPDGPQLPHGLDTGEGRLHELAQRCG
ncbi:MULTISPECIES: hypothetical protein [Kitasatospora]|nr:hypothetical protein [Kitasatospora sp. GP30]MDH6145045.1 hypothetical protein [Kitasatospora sp. GP30]